jgi:hypothetical protein
MKTILVESIRFVTVTHVAVFEEMMIEFKNNQDSLADKSSVRNLSLVWRASPVNWNFSNSGDGPGGSSAGGGAGTG